MSINTNNDTNSDALRNSENSQNYKLSSCCTEKYETQDEENTIDLENITAVSTDSSDEDDALSGRLSIDRMQNQLTLATDLESPVDSGNEIESVLHERADRLRSEMSNLREKLNEEMALWKKEREEFQLLREKSDALAFEEATAAARAAAAAYAVESPLSKDLNNIADITSKRSIRELAILEYEKNLAKYQNPYSFEQAEQRYKAYKHALADAYKQKLSEVERLCNEELEKIRQSADCLQPFQKIASQWSIDENNHGDSNPGSDDRSSMELSKIVDTNFDNDWCLYGKIDKEVNMVPEIVSARFKREEAA